jgi:hypothetical protein
MSQTSAEGYSAEKRNPRPRHCEPLDLSPIPPPLAPTSRPISAICTTTDLADCEPIFRAQEVSKRIRARPLTPPAQFAGFWWAHVVLARHS